MKLRLALKGAAVLSVTAAAVLVPGGPARAVSILSPAMTVAGGSSVIAVQTSEDGLRYYLNEPGTSNWFGEQVAANGTTFSPPAIAVVGNAVVIAAEGADNTLDLYWDTIGNSTSWNFELVASTGSTFSQPSLAQVGNTTVVAAEGPGNSLHSYWSPVGAYAWDPNVVAGAGTTFSAPSLASNLGAVNIAAEGPNGSLDYYWASNASSTWNPEVVAGAGAIESAPALTCQDGYSDIVARTGGVLGSTFYWVVNGSTAWAPSKMPTGDTSASSIVAYPGSPGGVHVAARDLFGSLVENTDVNGSGTWQFTVVTGGSPTKEGIDGSVPSIAMNAGSVNIAIEDTSGNLDFWWQDSSGTFHQELVDVAANL
jgi:hypothetical protein